MGLVAPNSTTNATIWESSPLEGACSGTPKISSDGDYIFLTHNLVTVGHFTILFSNKNAALYSQLNPNQPYSPPGIYHKPLEGRYKGGQNNSNDMLAFAFAPYPSEDGVGISATFGFQFPIGFNGTPPAGGFGVVSMRNTTFQSTSAPLLANKGYNLYFSASRSTFTSWVGAPGNDTGLFDQEKTASVEFTRGAPTQTAPFNTLAKSSNDTSPMLFGGTASEEFIALTFAGETMWKIATTFTIKSEARVSPDDLRVYFVESNGRVHSRNTKDGSRNWDALVTSSNTSVLSEIALDELGEVLYIGDTSGNVYAWKVANATPGFPSAVPSSAPSLISDKRPSSMPSFRVSTTAPSVYIPLLPPSPGEPACNICGGNLTVTIYNGTVNLPTDPPQVVSCRDWVALGNQGFLTILQCTLAPSFSAACGCQEPGLSTAAPAGVAVNTTFAPGMMNSTLNGTLSPAATLSPAGTPSPASFTPTIAPTSAPTSRPTTTTVTTPPNGPTFSPTFFAPVTAAPTSGVSRSGFTILIVFAVAISTL
jgi:hypothetical protein